MDSLLQTVTDLANSVMPGNPEASVLLLVKEHRHRRSTGRSPWTWTRAVRARPRALPARCPLRPADPDHRHPRRHPVAGLPLPRAVERGCLSSLSIPLAIDADEQVTGALNIYAPAARRVRRGQPIGRHPSSPRTPRSRPATCTPTRAPASMADNLQRALESRAITSTRPRACSSSATSSPPNQAFQLLAQASMHTNQKVRDIADHLVHTGQLPAVTPGGDRSRPGPATIAPAPAARTPRNRTSQLERPAPGLLR